MEERFVLWHLAQIYPPLSTVWWQCVVTLFLLVETEHHLNTFMAPLYPSADSCFQQGNMPLSSNHPKLVLKWPAQSSSLTPIENPLDVVEREIYITDVLLTNLHNCETLPCRYGSDHKELKQFLKWKRVPPSTMKVASQYIISMLKNL